MFGQEAMLLSVHQAQELYSRSFDLSPICVPYASVHLFGAESFKRAELMTGLMTSYAEMGFDCGPELPDHIAILLQASNQFGPEDWSDLSKLVLKPAVEKMLADLDGAGSPWRHVLRAVERILAEGAD